MSKTESPTYVGPNLKGNKTKFKLLKQKFFAFTSFCGQQSTKLVFQANVCTVQAAVRSPTEIYIT
jgi:hypothetical protein